MMSFEECQEWGRKIREEREELNRKNKIIRQEELRKMGIDINTQKSPPPKYDHPCTPDDGFITILYIVGMIASFIFTQWYVAWFGLTIAYVKFITRHDND